MGKRSKKRKNIRKKEAQKKAGAKRANIKKEKKASPPIETKPKEEKKEVVTSSVTPSFNMEEVLEQTSQFVERHQNALLILGVSLACAILFFTWQRNAKQEWELKAWQKVEKEAKVLEDFTATFEQKEKTLLRLLREYKNSPLESYLKLRLAHLYYHFQPNPDEQKKLSFEVVRKRLEKAKNLYEELAQDKNLPEGIRIMVKENFKAVQKELEYFTSPPKLKMYGLIQQES